MRSSKRHAAAGWCATGCVVVLLVAGGPPLDLTSLAMLRSLVATDPEALLEGAALDAAWVLALWLAVGALLHLAGCLPGQVGRAAARASSLVTPAVLRRALDVTVGVGLVAVPASPALAASPSVDRPSTSTASTTTVVPAPQLAPLVAVPDLDRPSPAPAATPPGRTPRPAPPPPAPAAAVPGSPAPGPAVVVQPGDSLWSIADARLGRGAAPAEVAHAWPAWWQANRSAIGDDPDLLRPGQRLVPPTGGAS